MTITLATLHEATAQQVFDQVAKHLLTQRRKSLAALSNPDLSGCAYRGDGNLKCAAGCLISDDEYDSDFEGEYWGGLVKLRKVPESHKALIDKLQAIHDERDAGDWPIALKELANKLELSLSPAYV